MLPDTGIEFAFYPSTFKTDESLGSFVNKNTERKERENKVSSWCEITDLIQNLSIWNVKVSR